MTQNIQCKYCPPNHIDQRKSFGTDRGYCTLYVDKNTQKASVRIFSYLSDDSYFETEFEVFYCPMCGRKLFEEKTDE